MSGADYRCQAPDPSAQIAAAEKIARERRAALMERADVARRIATDNGFEYTPFPRAEFEAVSVDDVRYPPAPLASLLAALPGLHAARERHQANGHRAAIWFSTTYRIRVDYRDGALWLTQADFDRLAAAVAPHLDYEDDRPVSLLAGYPIKIVDERAGHRPMNCRCTVAPILGVPVLTMTRQQADSAIADGTLASAEVDGVNVVIVGHGRHKVSAADAR